MKLSLTLACGEYDRTLALQNGSVRPDGIDINYLPMLPSELFRRQARHAEFDIAEFSLSTLCHLNDEGDRRLVAIPVFPSRKFRHSEIWVNTQAGIRYPADLRGKRIGAMEYQQTAAVWQRAMLQYDYGVSPSEVEWCFGAYEVPGTYSERVPLELPSSIRTTIIPNEKCLDQMLEDGEIDALMGADPPRCVKKNSPNVVRLFPDYYEAEVEYFRRTQLFPIMHTVVIKRELYEEHPWVATNLYKAFVEAKALAADRLPQAGALFCMLPWLLKHVEDDLAILGPDPFPYGLEENRYALETFMGYVHEQGIIKKPMTPDQLFASETHAGV